MGFTDRWTPESQQWFESRAWQQLETWRLAADTSELWRDLLIEPAFANFALAWFLDHRELIVSWNERDHFEPIFGINKELNLQFVLGYTTEEFARTLGNIAEGVTDVAPLITATVGINGVAQAFDDLSSPDHHAKILVEPWLE